MAWELVATGENLSDLPAYEAEVAEGQRAKLELKCAAPVPSFEIAQLRDALEAQGVSELQVYGTGNKITIMYRKNPWWLPVIIIALAFLTVVILLWLFYREVKTDLGPGAANLMLIGVAMAAFGILVIIDKSRGG